MTVMVVQLAPPRIGDPDTEPKERQRRRYTDQVRITDRQRRADGPQNDPEQKRRRDMPEPGDGGSARRARNRPPLLAAEDDDRRPVVGHERVKDADGGDGRDEQRASHFCMSVPQDGPMVKWSDG